jgi:uncharacterized protein YfaS (alpha-2-macroglobulin family)
VKKKSVVAGVLFGAALSTFALLAPADAGGPGTVEGTVVGPGGKPMAGVSVRIQCGAVTRSATADAAGHFVLTDLPEGTCTLSTHAKGLDATEQVQVTAGSIAMLLVNLQPPAPPMPPAEFDAAMAPMPEAAPAAMPPPPPARPAPMPMHHAGVARAAGGFAATPVKPMAVAPAVKRLAKVKDADPFDEDEIGGKVGRAAPKADVRMIEERPAMKELRDHDGDDKREAVLDQQQAVNGWATVRVFPVPQYTSNNVEGPRTDFRETIYWNPTVTTNGKGDADVSFVTSDAITGFKAVAEGVSGSGRPGAGEVTLQSKLPLTLDAHLPVEVTSGDELRLPVTLANDSDHAIDAKLDAKFGAAFTLASNPVTGPIHLAAGEKKSLFFPLKVTATDGSADVSLAISTSGLKDELKRTIRVVPLGFPFEVAASGTVHPGERTHQTFDLGDALPGSLHATVTMFPSPVSAMTKGMEGMIAEPGGCFEQTSSTNYPNVMILGYLQSADASGAAPALIEKTHGTLERGYKLLTGYETPVKGYEWFGHSPGHEALTAYGLMEFADMSKVYDVDQRMLDRTAAWLVGRRDGKGGFLRSSEALDSFGRASTETTNAYIIWALAEAKRTRGLDAEIAAQKRLAASTKDPYQLALAVNTELALGGSSQIDRLVSMQAKDGSFPGAKESITVSGGDSLLAETTALGVLALLKASPHGEHETQLRSGVEWLNAHRGGPGSWGSTQGTVLALRALTAYAEHARQMTTSGAATLIVNGKPAGTIKFEKGRRDALVWDDLSNVLVPGKNTLEVELEGGVALPYTIALDYRSAKPQSSHEAKVEVTTKLAASTVKLGEGVKLHAHVENRTANGVPMTLARVGIPGGLTFQTWQLKELRDKKLVDFYETRPREVILYWSSMAPKAIKDIDLDLLAATPGTYEAPASSAYLYYTAEDKSWAAPVKIAIDK